MSQFAMLNVAVSVIQAFEKLTVDYVIGGSLASSVYGVPRSTLDIDMVANIQAYHAKPLTRLLQDSFFIDEEMVKTAANTLKWFNLVHYESLFKVDVFIHRGTEYDDHTLARKVKKTLPTIPEYQAFFYTAEDLILRKLEWFRDHEEPEVHWRDVLGIMKVQTNRLDIGYMERWAEKIKLQELLAKALIDSGLRPVPSL